ncbi:MAG: hypothetical protein B6245_02200 [Desulfobacteraceae bacterium 4572_88]|nr:MAG: hypothetical protein B6245_02200 [Desulfobacteraceae bacterium 4572_88]
MRPVCDLCGREYSQVSGLIKVTLISIRGKKNLLTARSLLFCETLRVLHQLWNSELKMSGTLRLPLFQRGTEGDFSGQSPANNSGSLKKLCVLISAPLRLCERQNKKRGSDEWEISS